MFKKLAQGGDRVGEFSLPRLSGKIAMTKKRITLAICVILAFHSLASERRPSRPSSWAQPIERSGVPNLHKLTDNLYRSAQPTEQGMKNLRQMGIVTIINLRSFSSDRDEIGETDLSYEHIYMKAWHPERKEVVRFLQLVTNEKMNPVLVHCKHGADRTGTMCALYRVVVQGWTKEEAIQEMVDGGYGFHEIWANLPRWIEQLDIESIRKEIGIKNPEPTD